MLRNINHFVSDFISFLVSWLNPRRCLQEWWHRRGKQWFHFSYFHKFPRFYCKSRIDLLKILKFKQFVTPFLTRIRCGYHWIVDCYLKEEPSEGIIWFKFDQLSKKGKLEIFDIIQWTNIKRVIRRVSNNDGPCYIWNSYFLIWFSVSNFN